MAIKVNQEAATTSKANMEKARDSFIDSMRSLDKVVSDLGRTQEGNWVNVIQGKYETDVKPVIQKGITDNVEAFANMFIATVQKWMDIDAGVS